MAGFLKLLYIQHSLRPQLVGHKEHS